MNRHDRDDLSLVAGLAFLVIATTHLASELLDVSLPIDWMWTGPAILLVLGLLGLTAAVRRLRAPSDLT